MEQTITIKILGGIVGGAVSAFIMGMFHLSGWAFAAGFIGAFLGEMYRKESTFKEVLLVTGGISILAAWLGGFVLPHFELYPPTSIMGVAGFAIAVYRESMLLKAKEVIDHLFNKASGK